MTTHASDALPPTLDVTGTPPVPFGRLVRVELRKVVDTRAGFWLLTGTFVLLTAVMALLVLLTATSDATLTADGISQILVVPVSVLVPALAILTVTSEWGQRTHLITFALEPVRRRIVAAKLTVIVLLGAGTIVAAVAVGAGTNLLHGAIAGTDPVWDLTASQVSWTIVAQVLWFLMAFGLGMLLLNTPAAVTVFYVFGLIAPLVVHPPLYALLDGADRWLPWFDLTLASLPFATGADITGQAVAVGTTEWAQLAVTTLLWVVTPLVFGCWRVLRTEVR